MLKLGKIGNKMRNIYIYIVCSLILVIMIGLSMQSLLFTTLIDTSNESNKETVYYEVDNVLLNCLVLVLCIVILYFLGMAVKHISLKHIKVLLFAWFTVISIIWILSAFNPTFADSAIVKGIADSFSEGNYELKESQESYICMFPFQLGFIAYLQLLNSVLKVTTNNTVLLEIINVLLFAASMRIIVAIINNATNEKIAKITAVLCMTAIQPMNFCVFVYGNIPAFFFACMAVFFMLKFMQKYRWYDGVISALSIALSVTLKNNSYIILIAMIIYVCFDYFGNRKELIKKALFVLVSFCLSVGLISCVTAVYSEKTGLELKSGIPISCWLAMGLGESELEDGWFNTKYTTVLYKNNERDSQKTQAAAVEIIKEEIKGFAENPAAAVSFFYHKAVSQWNEPTYQSLWMCKITGEHVQRSLVADWLVRDGEEYGVLYMNFFQQMIFVLTAVGAFFCLKNKNKKLSIFALIIIGGFLYHLFFEAKAQYSLIYFVLMFPLAAYGAEMLFNFIKERILKKKRSGEYAENTEIKDDEEISDVQSVENYSA